MNIYYLGPEKTYSEQAAKKLAEKIKEKSGLRPLASVEAVARSIDGQDMGALAYYNYLEGLVQECLDQIYENNLRIIGAQRIPIILSIGSPKGNTDLTIYSHPKALAQCSEYLWNNHPKSRQNPSTSTAAGALKVSENKKGLAIASSEALLENGLEILAEDIGNMRQGRKNFTDFYLVAKGNNIPYEKDKEYWTMIAITPHIDKPGLLADILVQVAYHNLNNAKIHSRPALDNVQIGDLEPQMFYLEIMSHKDCPDFKRCVDSLKYKLTPKGKDVEVVRVLGSYERPNVP